MLLKQFEVAGIPQALKRHRSFRMGNSMRQVDPSKGDKADFLILAHSNKPDIPWDQPLQLVITFEFPRPKGHYRTGKNTHILKETAPLFHTGKPDVDNLSKFICDALNGVFWKDDSCICQMLLEKRYSDTPRTIISVLEAENPFEEQQ